MRIVILAAIAVLALATASTPAAADITVGVEVCQVHGDFCVGACPTVVAPEESPIQDAQLCIVGHL